MPRPRPHREFPSEPYISIYIYIVGGRKTLTVLQSRSPQPPGSLRLAKDPHICCIAYTIHHDVSSLSPRSPVIEASLVVGALSRRIAPAIQAGGSSHFRQFPHGIKRCMYMYIFIFILISRSSICHCNRSSRASIRGCPRTLGFKHPLVP